jgi:YVTN family beta-propeller protein
MRALVKWPAPVCLAVFVAVLAGCGDTYRPTALPVIPPGGDPQATSIATVVSNNNGGPGSVTEVDATGDTNVGVFQVGNDPVHAAYWNGGISRVYVANRSSDSVSYYSPTQIGSAVSTIGLPAGSRPVFVASGNNANIFVAESGTNNVAVIAAGSGAFTQELPVGINPVAIGQTPDGNWAYVANKGSNSVSIIAAHSLTLDATVPVGISPVWVTAKPDNSTVYVLNQGSGTVTVIDATSRVIVGTITVGASPHMMSYDSVNHRLYVANTGSNSVSVFDADPQVPTLLRTVAVGTAPTAVVPLLDGSRFYVTNSGCSDAVALTGCTGNTVSVVDARAFTIRKTVTVGTTPIWLAASADSSKVVVVNRDSNNVNDIRTLDDTVVSSINTSSPQPLFVTINGT